MRLVETAAPRRGTRPRNRRALIVAAAARLFVSDGYPQVSMRDIAAAVAITPPALYRHFRSKEDLLQETVESQLLAVRQALEEAPTWSECRHQLAEVILRHRHLGILWQRESRHLEPARRLVVRDRLVGVQEILAERLRGHRTDLSDHDVDLISWSALTAAMSISFHGVQLPHADYTRLLLAIIGDVVETHLTAMSVDAPQPGVPTPVPAQATADRLVRAALELFAERGFKSVGINDVAAAVGIAGPSAYSHFDSKSDLLTAAIGDGARVLLREEAEILADSRPPRETLRRLLRSYVQFSFAHHHVLDLMITEVNNLDDRRRSRLIMQQREYLRAWVRVLREAAPRLPPAEARVRVQAVLTLTNDLARTAHLRSRPDIQEATRAIGGSILGLQED